ncbi:hypothetical protein PR002_g7881 [Phytophthora rubi]|uniref:Fungal lipase-type domain-containing protein n=1 Tax=Phytophthora rubi TaxID=129364 RepID=A0A6A3MZY2_9STRA|nr:hypothetical protein PR002_g7881 [Phytophthora rubi]
MRPSDRQRGAAGASLGGGDAEEDRVYRPLLFQSTGYASSELFRDSYEMHSRLPNASSTAPLLGVETNATVSTQNQKPRHLFEPQIRLETLSSRAATAVLWVTYLAFLLAMALPYLQSKGYLETAVELPGGLCKPDQVRREPCIEVDATRNIAQWAAYVTNVSRYAGSVEIKLDVREQVNTSTSEALLSSLVESNTYQELERVGTAWKMDRDATRVKSILDDEGSEVSEIEDGEVDQEAGYVLTYDARLYGIDHDVTPVAKDLVMDEHNRSVWVECHTGEPCEIVRLLEITQDVDRLGRSGYDAYFAILTFRGMYPNVFGKDVVYQFAYTKPAIHVGEVVVRGVMVLSSILALPCWFISVLNFHGEPRVCCIGDVYFQDHRRLVISFRGTTSKENWRSNLRADQHVLWIKSRGLRWRRTCLEKVEDVAAKIPLLNMALPRVHRGFWIAYESIRDQLKEVTRLILDENPGVSVYITGHSMGGALAVLAAYDLAVNFSIKVNMYNFGGPRVGNPSFRQHYDRCVPTSYRVVMDGDIVPGWPKFWGLYQHVGTEISLDVAGNLIVDPSFVERHLHSSSRRKTTMHGTNVYRVSIAKCLENLTAS